MRACESGADAPSFFFFSISFPNNNETCSACRTETVNWERVIIGEVEKRNEWPFCNVQDIARGKRALHLRILKESLIVQHS